MATQAEYGPCLKKRIAPLITGVGPVEAGIGTARALAELVACGDGPTLAISLGSAGSNRLEQGKVYQVAAVSYRDMDASALGFEKGATPFLGLPVEITMPIRLHEVPAAHLSTGANIITGAAYQAIGSEMVDMETYGVLRACQGFELPLIGLRGISDGAHDLRQYSDWTALLGHLDEELAGIIDRLEHILP
jgi:adenosylhomocysteine nucleosidase